MLASALNRQLGDAAVPDLRFLQENVRFMALASEGMVPILGIPVSHW
jgi:hypothetical protein